MAYDDGVIDEILSRIDLVDIIGEYTKLQKKGSNHIGLCPFHSEKTPSFSVSAKNQMFYCFGCHKGGNVFTFLREIENWNNYEVLQELSQRTGISLPEKTYGRDGASYKKRADEKAKLFEINKLAALYFHRLLHSNAGKVAKEYLLHRGLSEETLKNFGLGYSDKFRDDCYQYLKSKGYQDEELKASGLIGIDEKDGGYDKFWNRVMFPIMDINNKVIAFGGRVMGKGEPKYLNSSETDIFDKSRNLYGLNYARKSRKDFLLLCEGYMDVIALHQGGFTNAVASLGTAFTQRQASLLSKYTQKVVISYDSDSAGINATMRTIPILQDAGLSVKVLDMTPYKDPDEFIKALGSEEYQKRIDEARSAFSFEIATMEKKYDLEEPEQVTRFQNDIANRLAAISDELERENYIQAVDRIYHIGLNNLRKRVNEIGERRAQKQLAEFTVEREREQSRKQKQVDSVKLQAQKILLCWAVEDKTIFHSMINYLSLSNFTDEPYKSVAKEMFSQYEAEGSVSAASILRIFETTEEQAQVAAIFSTEIRENMTEQERQRTFSDTIRRILEEELKEKETTAVKSNDAKAYQEILLDKNRLKKLQINISQTEKG